MYDWHQYVKLEFLKLEKFRFWSSQITSEEQEIVQKAI